MNPEPGASADARRSDVTLPVGRDSCAAWLYRPENVERPPVIVMAHGFGAIRTLRLDAYAQRFADAGYAVLVFDYRHFGDSTGQPRELLSLSRQRQDWQAAIAYARALPGVDTGRVVAWGSSLSGGHVLHAAAHDQDLAAVIAQVPHVSGPHATIAMGARHVTRLGVAAVKDLTRQLTGRSPYYVPSIGDTGTLAVMLDDDGIGILRRLAEGLDVDSFLPHNRVAARILLHMPFNSPGLRAHRITAPTLIQAGERDELTPTKASRWVARRIPDSVFKTYPCGHFDPYVDPHFEGVVADQIAFLNSRVPVRQ
ncbi:alpha/beta fold hydrolase [Micromonospora sp. NPDC049044]|uniref:alpha/beta hydrolase n=1 Tax=Micromonospora sp. NPDC049044 TaxID=3154827 RepID=UPI0033EDF81D